MVTHLIIGSAMATLCAVSVHKHIFSCEHLGGVLALVAGANIHLASDEVKGQVFQHARASEQDTMYNRPPVGSNG